MPALSNGQAVLELVADRGSSGEARNAPFIKTFGSLSKRDIIAIEELDSRFIKGWLAGDGETVLSVFSRDAVLMPPGSNAIEGLRKIRDYWVPNDGSHTNYDL